MLLCAFPHPQGMGLPACHGQSRLKNAILADLLQPRALSSALCDVMLPRDAETSSSIECQSRSRTFYLRLSALILRGKNNMQIPSQVRRGELVFVQVWGSQHGTAVTLLMLLARIP